MAEAQRMTAPVATPTIAPGATPGHFPCLDAYRGIGMTMVLLNHAAYATGFINQSSMGPYLARLDLSVPMFFVMSGFLLFRPYASAIADGRPPTPIRTFYRRRVWRILPSYWVALIGVGLLFGLNIATKAGWLGNALLLPAVGVPVQVCDGNNCRVAYGLTQAWSIGVEATYYLVLPVLAAALVRLCRNRSRAQRVALLIASCGLLYLAGTGFRIGVVAANPSWARESLLWLPMFLDLFAIGMGLAVVSTLSVSDTASFLQKFAARLASHPALCWSIALAGFVGMAQLSPPTEPFGLNGREYVPRQFVYGLASAAWLLPAMFGEQDEGILRRILASRPLVYLGAVSLSFYLWHLALVEQAKVWTVPDYAARQFAAANPADNPFAGLGVFTGNFFVVAAVAWVSSLLVAAVLHRFVEQPGVRFAARHRPPTESGSRQRGSRQ